MREKLQELLKNSYAPYSNYHVSSIVEMKDGSIFSGVNVENISYGGTICAERNAVNSAISHGYKKGDFQRIHIMNDTDHLGMPCFICRETFVEFFDQNLEVIVYTKDQEATYKVSEICPYPFDGVK